MPKDLRLSTKRTEVHDYVPVQEGNPDDFFGEATNDIHLGVLNDFDTIEGLEKLRQDILKILLTERGKNIVFPLYGSEIQTLIGKKLTLEYIKAKVKAEVVDSLKILQFINKDNPNLDEQIETLERLKIEQLDPRSIDITLTVITKSQKRLTLSATIV